MLEQIALAWQAMSGWELVAAGLSLLYLALAIRQNALCWYAAFGSTAIYSWLFWDVSLLMESALNVYYLGMAVYGWLQWQGKQVVESSDTALPISRWSARQHLLAVSVIGGLALLSGSILSLWTEAALPFLDSITTWGAVLATWMVARKVLENWLYWIVLNAISIYLFIDRELMITAVLFSCFEIMAVIGWFRWLRDYRLQLSSSNVSPS